ncbi:hypothetical protein [Thalassobacillus sp. C254]|uniref:hypothetical protein n=1 Tax=Thalassobacillus sp. C254 TaxID=1225341 RepID=UPI0022B72FE0|nr:hypothetical protein [Thalassobacillus sp. C254]
MSSNSHIAEVIVTMVPGSDRDVSTFEFTESIEREIENADDEADIQVMDMAQAGFGEPNTYQSAFMIQTQKDWKK